MARDRPQADVRRPARRAGADALEPLDEAVATGDVRFALRRRFHTLVDAAGLDEAGPAWVVVRMVNNMSWARRAATLTASG